MQTIEMEKMLVVNGETPANAYFMNKLQDNMADAITDVQNSVKDAMKSQETSSDEDTYNCNYINRKKDTLLYSNDEGSNGNIALNESVENFEHVKVVWSVNKQYFSTIEIYNPNNKNFYLNINTQNDGTRCWSQPNIFNDNVITRGTASYQNINGELNNANLIYIHKVVGCGRI